MKRKATNAYHDDNNDKITSNHINKTFSALPNHLLRTHFKGRYGDTNTNRKVTRCREIEKNPILCAKEREREKSKAEVESMAKAGE